MSNNMSNEPDNLDKLWQQQQTTTIDVKALSRQWKLTRIKQYMYSLMDAMALMLFPLVIYFFPKELSTFEFVWLSGLFALMTGWFVFIVWLRRFSLGFDDGGTSTQDFVYRMKMQYRQNIRIAHYNKLLCWVVPVVFLTYIVVAYLGEYVSPDVLWRKSKLLFVTSLVFLPATWIWAHKREQKFKRLLADFDARWVA
ncbi:hypothetical protein [Aliiglaciecola litoralis]|uniref:RDD family protein n=1 Tax=Aliiglaciecola litoralis TaxID=582857 RepID=A0ABP3WPY3_9ALTE